MKWHGSSSVDLSEQCMYCFPLVFILMFQNVIFVFHITYDTISVLNKILQGCRGTISLLLYNNILTAYNMCIV